MLESVNRVVLNGASTTSVTLSVTGVGLIMVPLTAGVACALPLGKKVLHKLTLNKKIGTKTKMKKINKLFNLSKNYI